MKIELNQKTFRRLVQLYLALFLLSIPLTVWEVLSPTYEAFDLEFQELVERHYGHAGPSDGEMVAFGVILLAHLASIVGLLRFKRWARLLSWCSILLLLALDTILGPPATWYTRWASWSEVFGSALFGVIILMSYASGLGAVWFEPSDKNERI